MRRMRPRTKPPPLHFETAACEKLPVSGYHSDGGRLRPGAESTPLMIGHRPAWKCSFEGEGAGALLGGADPLAVSRSLETGGFVAHPDVGRQHRREPYGGNRRCSAHRYMFWESLRLSPHGPLIGISRKPGQCRQREQQPCCRRHGQTITRRLEGRLTLKKLDRATATRRQTAAVPADWGGNRRCCNGW